MKEKFQMYVRRGVYTIIIYVRRGVREKNMHVRRGEVLRIICILKIEAKAINMYVRREGGGGIKNVTVIPPYSFFGMALSPSVNYNDCSLILYLGMFL